ncbi:MULTISPECIES: hypothetical protein [unclassified Corallococcus]|uniref:hypothetical protein n=1 Tax=unclassified Corallococcus TaxID=2685029 RepID=UPI001A901802|nr:MULTISPECIES: hypothetical protein [unclassified Corallococcus]MBN9682583.1 hypothetical protein [Corallococcus sp. NCSPR001]WAS85871.1 hypothetical protein O0N60_02600 [Corallococcus sp. NCRR]
MNAVIDLDYIKLLKREAAELASAAASSHLTEAIAAGFGFKTNAALKAALKQGPIQAALDDNAAWQRLIEIGADPCPPKGMLRLAAMRPLVKDAMDAMPELTTFGLEVHSPQSKTREQIESEFAKDRAAMLKPSAIEEFDRCYQWLTRLEKTKAINASVSSYGLKHKVESHWRTVAPGGLAYVANGMCIAAAHAAGFKVARVGDSPNAMFNISRRSLKANDPKVNSRSKSSLNDAWKVEWSDHRLMRAPNSTEPPASYQRVDCPDEEEAIARALSLIGQNKFYVNIRRGREMVYGLAELQAIAYWHRQST